MNYKELSDISNSLYDKFNSGDRQLMLNCLATLTHNPTYSIRNSLVLFTQYGKPPRKVYAYKTESDKEEWKVSGRRIKKGAKQLSYWIPEKYKDENGKTKTKFLMTWGYEIRDTTDKLELPKLNLVDIANHLTQKYDIKISAAKGLGAGCKKIDKNHIAYDIYAPSKDKQVESIGQILRCICPSSKPTIIGAMVVYRYTGDVKLLAREVGRKDISLSPEDIKEIKTKYSLLIQDLNLLEKRLEKEKAKEKEFVDKNIEVPSDSVTDGPIEI